MLVYKVFELVKSFKQQMNINTQYSAITTRVLLDVMDIKDQQEMMETVVSLELMPLVPIRCIRYGGEVTVHPMLVLRH